jgi:hypothetical protein
VGCWRGAHGAKEGEFKREGAAEEEGDHVGGADGRDVGDLLLEDAVAEDAIAGAVSADVSTRRNAARLKAPGLANVEEGAGLWVADAEEEEVEGLRCGEDDEVRLRIPRACACGGELVLTCSAHGPGASQMLCGDAPELSWVQLGEVHFRNFGIIR